MKASCILNREILQERLAAQALLAKAFQSVFGLAPTMEQLETLSRPVIEKSVSLMEFSDGESASDIDAFSTVVNDRSSTQVEHLRSEYTRLFVGPGKLPAPPWESVYRGEDRLLLQASTLEIRALYRSQGMLPAHYPTVADDHVALELSFLHLMTTRMYDLVADDEVAAYPIYSPSASAASQIVNEHLLAWLPQFSRALSCDNPHGYYAVSARLLVRFIRACSRFAEEA